MSLRIGAGLSLRIGAGLSLRLIAGVNIGQRAAIPIVSRGLRQVIKRAVAVQAQIAPLQDMGLVRCQRDSEVARLPGHFRACHAVQALQRRGHLGRRGADGQVSGDGVVKSQKVGAAIRVIVQVVIGAVQAVIGRRQIHAAPDAQIPGVQASGQAAACYDFLQMGTPVIAGVRIVRLDGVMRSKGEQRRATATYAGPYHPQQINGPGRVGYFHAPSLIANRHACARHARQGVQLAFNDACRVAQQVAVNVSHMEIARMMMHSFINAQHKESHLVIRLGVKLKPP